MATYKVMLCFIKRWLKDRRIKELGREISDLEYGKKRKKRKFVEWVSDRTAQLQSDSEIAADFRKRKGLWKNFAEEVLPLNRFVLSSGNCHCSAHIQMFSGNQSYDAVITSGKNIKKFEVTTTRNLVDAYRGEYSNKHGIAPVDTARVANGKDFSVAKKNGFPEDTGHAVYGDMAQEAELDRICDRIRAKLNHNNYEPGLILIVHCLETLLDIWDLDRITNEVRTRLAVDSHHPFSEIWLTFEDNRVSKLY